MKTDAKPLPLCPTEIDPHRLYRRTEAAFLLGQKPQTLAAWYTTKRYDLKITFIGTTPFYLGADLIAFRERGADGPMKAEKYTPRNPRGKKAAPIRSPRGSATKRLRSA